MWPLPFWPAPRVRWRERLRAGRSVLESVELTRLEPLGSAGGRLRVAAPTEPPAPAGMPSYS